MGAGEIRICVTPAFRHKVNRSQFLLECSREFGVLPQILSGRDEARLDYIGAMTDAAPNEKDDASVDYGDVKEDSSENN